MFVPFDSLPGTARIWIYQADRKLNEVEKTTISSVLHSFTSQWTAHQQPLKASFAVLHDYFVVLAVDESYTEASGCSIDSSVAVIRQLCAQLDVDLLGRNKIAFYIDEQVHLIPINELKSKQQEGFWSANATVFDNTILTKDAFLSSWKTKAAGTWLNRYLSTKALQHTEN
ncbi:MAG: hypothetical protein KF687_02180 [Cyclobacteriaceae bacterium]|nr:hypothetical protein [Cyclobacteriaceae bacterium]